MQIKDKALIKGFSFVVEFLELEPVANKVTFWTRPQIQVQVHETRSDFIRPIDQLSVLCKVIQPADNFHLAKFNASSSALNLWPNLVS